MAFDPFSSQSPPPNIIRGLLDLFKMEITDSMDWLLGCVGMVLFGLRNLYGVFFF